MTNQDDPFDNFSVEFNKLDRERIAAREELAAVDAEVDRLNMRLNDAVNRRSQILNTKSAIESELNVSKSQKPSALA